MCRFSMVEYHQGANEFGHRVKMGIWSPARDFGADRIYIWVRAFWAPAWFS
jgi:hypothetical protein